MTYDCFPFFNELDLLDLRLDTLTGVVDRFVLVESTRTHTNGKKPLYFDENKARYEKYRDRIVHVIVDDNPEGGDPWVRERHQRDCILRGLESCSPKDTILISDLDEIPNPARIQDLHTIKMPFVFEQFNCYYFLNAMNGYWFGTRAVPFELLAKSTCSEIRQASGRILSGGGWHFSFISDVDGILKKLKAYAHQEFNTEHYADRERVSAAIATGADLFSRARTKAKLIEPALLPHPLVENRAAYARYLATDLVRHPSFRNPSSRTSNSEPLSTCFQYAKPLSGRTIQIGCGEGRSTSLLAREAWPNTLHAVDRWDDGLRGNDSKIDSAGSWEGSSYRTFLQNMFVLTRGNFHAHRTSITSYLASDSSPIKFCHICGERDLESLRSTVQQLLPVMVAGGILCLEDCEGAEEIARDILPGFRAKAQFLWWKKDSPTPSLGGRAKRLFKRLALSKLKQSAVDNLRYAAPSTFDALQDWWWRRQARKRMQSWAAGLEKGER